MRMLALYLSPLLVSLLTCAATAEILEFDMLPHLESAQANKDLESTVELGVTFSGIDEVSILVSGSFTPGWMQAVSPFEPNMNAVVPSDNVWLEVRLGETGSPWIDKDLYWSETMQGESGLFVIDERLRQAVKGGEGPTLLPSGDEAPDFGFMLDGRFGFSAGTSHAVAFLYQVLEHPSVEITEFTLRVQGTATPEPSVVGLSLGLLFLATALPRSRRNKAVE